MLNLVGDFLLPLPDLKLSKMLPSSLGFAFGITCFDIVLSKEQSKIGHSFITVTYFFYSYFYSYFLLN